MATVLAIETSCDETAVAIVKDRQVLSSIVATQIPVHQRYGGIVPEVASRQHVETINPAIAQALQTAGLDWSAIDGDCSHLCAWIGWGAVGWANGGQNPVPAASQALDRHSSPGRPHLRRLSV